MEEPVHFQAVDSERVKGEEVEETGPPIEITRVKYYKTKGKYPRPGPRLVRQEFERLGFVMAPPEIPMSHCQAIWAMHMDKTETSGLLPFQTVNWFPAMPEITIKDLLHRNLYRMKQTYGDEHFKFWPHGFDLPSKWEEFKKEFTSEDGTEKRIPFIIKPSRNACGVGIRCVTRVSQLDTEEGRKWVADQRPLAQKYVLNPQCISGFKITFRIYVLVTSWDPLRLYITKDGLTRICGNPYTEDLDSFDDLHTHLTNIAINKDRVHVFENVREKDLPTEGLRLLSQYVFQRWKKEGKDVKKMWRDMEDAAVKSFLSAESTIQHYVQSSIRYRSNCYEIVGFDFLVDEDMQPWLLEINHAPDLEPYTSMETEVKRMAIRGALQIVDVERKDAAVRSRTIDRALKFLATLPPEKSIYMSPITGATFDRHGLSQTDIYTIVDTELESRRVGGGLSADGGWKRIFPNADSDKYAQFFQVKNRNKLIIDYLKTDRRVADVFEFPNYYPPQH